MSASIAYYRYPYFWLDYGVTDYPLTRRMLLSSPAAAEAQRLRNIDWRIRKLEMTNWSDYEIPPPTAPIYWPSYHYRYLSGLQRQRLADKWLESGLLIDYPRFTKRLLDTEVRSGHNVYLEVKVQGSPTAEVKWYKNGQPLVETHNVYVTHYRPDSYVLTIRDAMTSDRGLYSCEASNVVGLVTTSSMVTVQSTNNPRPDTSVTFYDKLYDL